MLRCFMAPVVGILRRMMKSTDAKCEKGKTLPGGVTEYADLSYGPCGAAGMLDVYVPEGASGLPVIFDVHGGGLVYGCKELNKRFCYALALRGFAVVSINYRLAPAVNFPEQLRDVTAAMRWTAENISSYGGDAERAYLCGDSAGALLAMYAGAISASAELQKAFGNEGGGLRPRACFYVSGLYDLRTENYIKHLCSYACGRGYKKSAWYPYTDLGALADAAPLPPLFLTSSDEDMLADQTTHFAEFLRARGAAFEPDFRPKNADKNAHRYEHIYPVKHPEWEECAELIDRACAFMRRY